MLDEAVLDHQEDGEKLIWVLDNREKSNPVSISTFPSPREADYRAKPGHFGPHNLHENRPGSFVSSSLIFATYQNAGIRAFDIGDPYRPAEVGALVPPPNGGDQLRCTMQRGAERSETSITTIPASRHAA